MVSDGQGQRVGEGCEAAAVIGQPFPAASAAAAAPELELVPEPHRRHLFRQVAELAPQERRPHHPVDPLATHVPQPVGRDAVFEAAPLLHPAHAQCQQPQPDAVEERKGREAQEVEGRRELEEVVGVVRAGPGRTQHHLGRPAQLRDEIHHMNIVGEPVVVELLEPHRRRESCRRGRRLRRPAPAPWRVRRAGPTRRPRLARRSRRRSPRHGAGQTPAVVGYLSKRISPSQRRAAEPSSRTRYWPVLISEMPYSGIGTVARHLSSNLSPCRSK